MSGTGPPYGPPPPPHTPPLGSRVSSVGPGWSRRSGGSGVPAEASPTDPSSAPAAPNTLLSPHARTAAAAAEILAVSLHAIRPPPGHPPPGDAKPPVPSHSDPQQEPLRELQRDVSRGSHRAGPSPQRQRGQSRSRSPAKAYRTSFLPSSGTAAAIVRLSESSAAPLRASAVISSATTAVLGAVTNALDAGATVIDVDLDLGRQRFAVADNGCGMTEDILSRIGVPHVTTKAASAASVAAASGSAGGRRAPPAAAATTRARGSGQAGVIGGAHVPSQPVLLPTLGYKGEFLASLSEVAHVTVVTRPRIDVRGASLPPSACACACHTGGGTTVMHSDVVSEACPWSAPVLRRVLASGAVFPVRTASFHDVSSPTGAGARGHEWWSERRQGVPVPVPMPTDTPPVTVTTPAPSAAVVDGNVMASESVSSKLSRRRGKKGSVLGSFSPGASLALALSPTAAAPAAPAPVSTGGGESKWYSPLRSARVRATADVTAAAAALATSQQQAHAADPRKRPAPDSGHERALKRPNVPCACLCPCGRVCLSSLPATPSHGTVVTATNLFASLPVRARICVQPGSALNVQGSIEAMLLGRPGVRVTVRVRLRPGEQLRPRRPLMFTQPSSRLLWQREKDWTSLTFLPWVLTHDATTKGVYVAALNAGRHPQPLPVLKRLDAETVTVSREGEDHGDEEDDEGDVVWTTEPLLPSLDRTTREPFASDIAADAFCEWLSRLYPGSSHRLTADARSVLARLVLSSSSFSSPTTSYCLPPSPWALCSLPFPQLLQAMLTLHGPGAPALHALPHDVPSTSVRVNTASAAEQLPERVRGYLDVYAPPSSVSIASLLVPFGLVTTAVDAASAAAAARVAGAPPATRRGRKPRSQSPARAEAAAEPGEALRLRARGKVVASTVPPPVGVDMNEADWTVEGWRGPGDTPSARTALSSFLCAHAEEQAPRGKENDKNKDNVGDAHVDPLERSDKGSAVWSVAGCISPPLPAERCASTHPSRSYQQYFLTSPVPATHAGPATGGAESLARPLIPPARFVMAVEAVWHWAFKALPALEAAETAASGAGRARRAGEDDAFVFEDYTTGGGGARVQEEEDDEDEDEATVSDVIQSGRRVSQRLAHRTNQYPTLLLFLSPPPGCTDVFSKPTTASSAVTASSSGGGRTVEGAAWSAAGAGGSISSIADLPLPPPRHGAGTGGGSTGGWAQACVVAATAVRSALVAVYPGLARVLHLCPMPVAPMTAPPPTFPTASGRGSRGGVGVYAGSEFKWIRAFARALTFTPPATRNGSVASKGYLPVTMDAETWGHLQGAVGRLRAAGLGAGTCAPTVTRRRRGVRRVLVVEDWLSGSSSDDDDSDSDESQAAPRPKTPAASVAVPGRPPVFASPFRPLASPAAAAAAAVPTIAGTASAKTPASAQATELTPVRVTPSVHSTPSAVAPLTLPSVTAHSLVAGAHSQLSPGVAPSVRALLRSPAHEATQGDSGVDTERASYFSSTSPKDGVRMAASSSSSSSSLYRRAPKLASPAPGSALAALTAAAASVVPATTPSPSTPTKATEPLHASNPLSLPSAATVTTAGPSTASAGEIAHAAAAAAGVASATERVLAQAGFLTLPQASPSSALSPTGSIFPGVSPATVEDSGLEASRVARGIATAGAVARARAAADAAVATETAAAASVAARSAAAHAAPPAVEEPASTGALAPPTSIALAMASPDRFAAGAGAPRAFASSGVWGPRDTRLAAWHSQVRGQGAMRGQGSGQWWERIEHTGARSTSTTDALVAAATSASVSATAAAADAAAALGAFSSDARPIPRSVSASESFAAALAGTARAAGGVHLPTRATRAALRRARVLEQVEDRFIVCIARNCDDDDDDDEEEEEEQQVGACRCHSGSSSHRVRMTTPRPRTMGTLVLMLDQHAADERIQLESLQRRLARSLHDLSTRAAALWARAGWGNAVAEAQAHECKGGGECKCLVQPHGRPRKWGADEVIEAAARAATAAVAAAWAAARVHSTAREDGDEENHPVLAAHSRVPPAPSFSAALSLAPPERLIALAQPFPASPFLRQRRLGQPVALPLGARARTELEAARAVVEGWGITWEWGVFEHTKQQGDGDALPVSEDAVASVGGKEVEVRLCRLPSRTDLAFVRTRTRDGDPIPPLHADCAVILAVPSLAGAALEPARDVPELLAALAEAGGVPVRGKGLVKSFMDIVQTASPSTPTTTAAAAAATALRGSLLRTSPPAFARVLALRACRSAVKFGDPLPRARLRGIVRALGQCGNPWACAHGRPTGVPVAVLPGEEEMGDEESDEAY